MIPVEVVERLEGRVFNARAGLLKIFCGLGCLLTFGVKRWSDAQHARTCVCTKPHTVLRGQGPGGKAWTAIASLYWQAFAHAWASECSFRKPCADELIPVSSHLVGLGVAPDDVPLSELLEKCDFFPSGGASIATSAMRVASGL